MTVGKETDYWLVDRGSDTTKDVRIYHHVQITSEVHTASYPMATDSSFLGSKDDEVWWMYGSLPFSTWIQ